MELDSRGSKPLTRYFPELVAQFSRQMHVSCVVNGDIIVRRGTSGSEHLDWEALSQRIHPADSRIQHLSHVIPADFVAFDLLYLDGKSLKNEPFESRRKALKHLFEGAGLDGVVSKPLAAAYVPGKRSMPKTKHTRTADVVVLGYRIHSSGEGVGSVLVGLHDGAAITGAPDRSRFSGSRDPSFVRLHPELVVEVRYDHREGARFRHAVQFERWRPDREASSSTFDQLERPVAYDLRAILG